jgi:hypothetical protein
VSVKTYQNTAFKMPGPSDWLLANPFGILAAGSIDPRFPAGGPPQWNAGRLNDSIDVIDIKNGQHTTLVADDLSGIWLIDPVNGNAAIPVSFSLLGASPGVQCLAHGSRTDFHLYAGGFSLWEHDSNTTNWTTGWTQVTINDALGTDLGAGTIRQVAVDLDTESTTPKPKLVLACDQGLFWAFINDDPSVAYVFKKAIDHSSTNVKGFSGVTPCRRKLGGIGTPRNPLGPPILASAWGDGTVGGIFSGEFVVPGPNLILTLIKLSTGPGGIPVADFTKMHRTSVTSQGPRGDYAYAVAEAAPPARDVSGRGGGILCVLFSPNGPGGQWSLTSSDVDIVGGHELFGGNTDITGIQGNYNNTIAVSPTDPGKVVIGWEFAYFVSKDFGNDWTKISGDSPNLHSDFHSIRFDGSDSGQNTLKICCDGGFMTTTDLGATHSSVANKGLPNLQVYRGVPDNQNIGLLAAALQDNGSISCDIYPVANPKPWQPFAGGDGFEVVIIRDGQILTYGNASPGVEQRRLDIFERPASGRQSLGLVPLDGSPNTGLAFPGPGGVLEPVDTPTWRSATNESLVAVAALGQQLFGLFAAPDELNKKDQSHWTTLASTPLHSSGVADFITAAASADGTQVFLGTSTGRMFIAKPPASLATVSWDLTALTLNRPDSDIISISSIRTRISTGIFGLATSATFPQCRFLTFDPPTTSWTQTPNAPDQSAANPLLEVISSPNLPSPDRIFIATITSVFQSSNAGLTWSSISSGLPSVTNASDLRFLREPSGAEFLYLATQGWSTWRKQLNFVPDLTRTVTLSGTAGINGVTDQLITPQSRTLVSSYPYTYNHCLVWPPLSKPLTNSPNSLSNRAHPTLSTKS